MGGALGMVVHRNKKYRICYKRKITNLDGDVVAALGGDDAVVPVVVDRVVVDGDVVAVVVRVEAVADVVVHLVVPPVSLLVAVRVNSEVEVVDVGIVDVAEHTNFIEQLGVALILAVSSDLVRRWLTRFRRF